MIYDKLFPVVIGRNLNSNIDESEHSDLMNLEYISKEGYSMMVTKDGRVLDSYAPNLKKFIQESLDEYCENVLGSNNKLQITQSWCTKQSGEKHQFIHPHKHPNSIVSGTYYVYSDSDSAPISFFQPNEQVMFNSWEIDTNTDYNVNEHRFSPLRGGLLLFPSWLKHSVENEIVGNSRCSLAFNTWFEDVNIGNESSFTMML